MRYVPKIRLTFRLPTGAAVGQAFPPGLLLKDAVHRAWPEAPSIYRVLRQGEDLSQDRDLSALGFANDTELEVLV